MFSRFQWGAERTYLLMSAAMALFDSTMFVYLTVFYFTVVGMNPLQLVLVGTVLEGSILFLEVPTGVVADTFSRRLSVLLGVFILGLGFLLTGLARTFAIVLVAQVICALGYTFLSGATDAWLADEIGEKQVGRVYLRSGQINRLVGMVGILLSAALASIRLDLPILVGGALYLVLGVFLMVIMPENHFQPFRHELGTEGLPAMIATFREGVKVIRARPNLINLVLINFFGGAASEGFDRLGDAHLLANFIFPALILPMFGTLNPIVWFSILSLAGSLLSLLVVERLRARLERLTTDLKRTSQALVILNLLFAGCGIGFALAGSFPLAVVCLLLRSICDALIGPLFNAYQVQAVSSRVRATVLSIASQGNALGQVAGGPVVGWVGTGSLRAALTLAGLLVLPNSLLYGRGIASNLPDEPDTSPGPELDSED